MALCNSVTINIIAKSFYYLCVQVLESNGDQWILFLIYGCHRMEERQAIWSQVFDILIGKNMPIGLVGDFNQVINPEDKLSSSSCSVKLKGSKLLKDLLRNLNLCMEELNNLGSCFTWTNKRDFNSVFYEILDRVIVNNHWLQKFPRALLRNLPIMRSVHGPLILETKRPLTVNCLVTRKFEA